MHNDELMAYEPVLPENFDGTFRFSNPSDEDFTGVWNKKEYLFKAKSTSKMIIPEHSPLEIQHIRKKFAKDLAEREFFKGKKYEQYRVREGVKDDMGMIQPRGQGMSHAGQYTVDGDLKDYIQRCLQPLEAAELVTKAVVETPMEDKLHRDDDGQLVTQAIDKKTSLRDKARTA